MYLVLFLLFFVHFIFLLKEQHSIYCHIVNSRLGARQKMRKSFAWYTAYEHLEFE